MITGEELTHFLGVKHHFPTDTNKVYVREMSAPAGYTIGTHKHSYDHYSILGSGTVTVDVDGVEHDYTAPSVILIEAGKEHKITSKTDFTWFCIHHTDVIDETQIDEVLIEESE